MKGSTGYSDTSLMDVGMLCFLLLMVSSLDTIFSVLAISLGHIDCVSGEGCDMGEGQGSVSVERVVIGEVDGRLYVSGESGTGEVDGRLYVSGESGTGEVDGRLYVSGESGTGEVDGRLYVSGESGTGEVDGRLYVSGESGTGEVDGSPFGVIVHCCVALGYRRLALVSYCHIGCTLISWGPSVQGVKACFIGRMVCSIRNRNEWVWSVHAPLEGGCLYVQFESAGLS